MSRARRVRHLFADGGFAGAPVACARALPKTTIEITLYRVVQRCRRRLKLDIAHFRDQTGPVSSRRRGGFVAAAAVPKEFVVGAVANRMPYGDRLTHQGWRCTTPCDR